MRLLIAFTQPFSYSETFIHNQVKYLEPVATLTNGWMPFQDAHRKSIFNGLFMVDVIRGGHVLIVIARVDFCCSSLIFFENSSKCF